MINQNSIVLCTGYGDVQARRRRYYLKNIFITGAAVCVVRYICDYSIFLHSYCPYRHHHFLPSQHSSVQDLCVLERSRGKMSYNNNT